MTDTTQPALPPGWMWTTIGSVINLASERVLPSSYPQLPYIGLEHIEAQTMRLLGYASGSSMKGSATRFQAGDVLYGRLRPYLNKVYLPDFDGVCSSELLVFRCMNAVHAEFLQYFLNQSSFATYATRVNAGDRPRVNYDQIARYPFPLAPLAEQRRIVAKIEGLFTELDVGVAALKRAQAKLRRYKASVLKAACEGRLVPQDPSDEPADILLQRILAERRARHNANAVIPSAQREESEPQPTRFQAEAEMPHSPSLSRGRNDNRRGRTKYVEPALPDTRELPELPMGWVWATLQELSWDARYGTSQKCEYEADGPPVIRIPNISEKGFELTDLKFATDKDALEMDAALAVGDLLIIRTNGSKDLVGRGTLVRNPFEISTYFASYLIRYRMIRPIMNWVSCIWHSPIVRGQIERMAATSAGQYNVSVGSLDKLSLPLPPHAEQQRIVAEVERRLSVAAAIESTLNASLARAEHLRQAILRRAFSGQLVPQDPNDEPASVLLERIRDERDPAT